MIPADQTRDDTAALLRSSSVARTAAMLPQRVSRSADSWPLFDRAATHALETAALAQVPPRSLMQAAGTSVARLALALAPTARLFEVACGSGNNGGDGLVAARLLHQMGRRVCVVLLDPGRAPPPDAAWALQAAVDAGVPFVSADGPMLHASSESAPGRGDFLVDAMLGLGASRGLDGAMATWAQQRAGTATLAVDLPSGLNPDTGAFWGGPGGVAVRATHTLSLLTLKPGLFTANGRDFAGEVWLDPLGQTIDERAACATLAGLRQAMAGLTPRNHASHKGRYGDVVVVGGAEGMSGAADLAAQAALAAGAGRVYLSALAKTASTPLPRAELMRRDSWWKASPAELGTATVVCGCGGGDDIADVMPALLSHVPQLVLDADALNALARDGLLARLQVQRAAKGFSTILTPHPLEAARLLATSTAEVMSHRWLAAAVLADRWQAVVVLKGSGSVVAAPGSRPFINASGNAALASPGTGDVLAGWIGGQWASTQGAKADAALATNSALQAAITATWLHGHAADRWVARCYEGPGATTDSASDFGYLALRAQDLIEHMHQVTSTLPARR